MALPVAMLGLSIFQGIQQQKAGKAAKKEADELAELKRRRANDISGIAIERQHDILVEGKFEKGALRARGAAAGVSGGSLATLGRRLESRTRRRSEELQRETNLTLSGLFTDVEQLRSRGRRAKRAGRRQAIETFVGGGFGFFGSLLGPGTTPNFSTTRSNSGVLPPESILTGNR